LAQAAALPPSPPRQNVPNVEPLCSTPPSVAKHATQSSYEQSVHVRNPGKLLPVQEEFEDSTYDQRAKNNNSATRDSGGEYVRYSNRYDREGRDLERQHHATLSIHLLLLRRTSRVPSAAGMKILSKISEGSPMKQSHDGEDEVHSGRTQLQDESYTVTYTPRSLSATLPPEHGLGSCDSP
jgi:hypothetical protein